MKIKIHNPEGTHCIELRNFGGEAPRLHFDHPDGAPVDLTPEKVKELVAMLCTWLAVEAPQLMTADARYLCRPTMQGNNSDLMPYIERAGVPLREELEPATNSACVVCRTPCLPADPAPDTISWKKLPFGLLCSNCEQKYVPYLDWARYPVREVETGKATHAFYCPDCFPNPAATKTAVEIGTACERCQRTAGKDGDQ